MSDIKSETIALAALFQCCTQIQRVASTGYYDENAVACVLRALIVTNPRTVEDIYPMDGLKVGFKQIVDGLSKSSQVKDVATIDITKVALKLISLAISVERNGRIFDRLSDEIDELKQTITREFEDFLQGNPQSVNDQNNIHLFGTLYQSIISPNFAKLLIYGEEQHLRVPANQEKIRALLLAGIRAVILWRQIGGRRRFLVFRRKAIVEYAKQHM